jgi:hypothetical protein
MPADTIPAAPAPNPFTTARCDACGETFPRCTCYPHGSPRYTREDAPVTFQGSPTARFPRYVGVEVECGTPDHPRSFRPVHEVTRTTGAGLHGDGSIRGFSYGLELVTAPSRGEAAERNIRAACQGLQAIGASVNESCGAHVHVDARDYSPADLVRLAYLLSVKGVEKTLYSVVSRSRRIAPRRGFTMFALPWGAALGAGAVSDIHADPAERYRAFLCNTYGSVQTAESVKRSIATYGPSHGKHGSRYHGVSFNAHDIRGTIEFRLHHGTVNARKLTMWAAVCSAIIQYVKDHTDEEIAALRGTPAEVLQAILTDREVSRWVRVRRRFFEDKDRQRRGLPPRRAARPAVAPPVDLPPEEDASSVEEEGETRATGVRSGRRMPY